MNVTRRNFVRIGGGASAGLVFATQFGWVSAAGAVPLLEKLSDPALQPKFVETVPNALDPSSIFRPGPNGEYTVGAGKFKKHRTGLIDPFDVASGRKNPKRLKTSIFGYGQDGEYAWPGKTFEVERGQSTTVVNWENNLDGVERHLLPVDTSLHWAYSLHGYDTYSIKDNGVPLIAHLHGGHSDFQFDGNPEFFFSPGNKIVGPQWEHVRGGFTNRFVYDNDVQAGALWYHDHALGLTRLNVYAGLAGFYFVRDNQDTGRRGNPLGLPVFPYEMALLIQDRMFKAGGNLFYPARPGHPFWDDFITDQGLDKRDVPRPSALAEFFGDHMVVNGKIWPKADVEPRNYRLRLLNGSDSRFLVVRFRQAAASDATDLDGAGPPLPFHVIGSDQGLASSAASVDSLLIGPGERYDVIVNFERMGRQRVIMENLGADAPFGGPLSPGEPDPADLFVDRQTDRIMAFDVGPRRKGYNHFEPSVIKHYGGNPNPVTAPTRKVALFEGKDEFGRLQPLLGTAEPVVDAAGNTVSGAIAWASPTTERPIVNETEIWEIYNATGDAHPVHLHLINFEVIDREGFTADVIQQPLPQHNGTEGLGFRLENIVLDGKKTPPAPVERAPKDMVTALPDTVTRIKVTFDKVGRYVWHCHILSHEDHEMMRVLEVLPADDAAASASVET